MGIGAGRKCGASEHPESGHDRGARIRLACGLAEAARVQLERRPRLDERLEDHDPLDARGLRDLRIGRLDVADLEWRLDGTANANRA